MLKSWWIIKCRMSFICVNRCDGKLLCLLLYNSTWQIQTSEVLLWLDYLFSYRIWLLATCLLKYSFCDYNLHTPEDVKGCCWKIVDNVYFLSNQQCCFRTLYVLIFCISTVYHSIGYISAAKWRQHVNISPWMGNKAAVNYGGWMHAGSKPKFRLQIWL